MLLSTASAVNGIGFAFCSVLSSPWSTGAGCLSNIVFVLFCVGCDCVLGVFGSCGWGCLGIWGNFDTYADDFGVCDSFRNFPFVSAVHWFWICG